MKLLVIRPQPGADATAARIMNTGHEALLLPLFAVEPVAWDAPSAHLYDAVLLTSANAAREAGPQLSAFAHLPVMTVGKVTAAAAEQAGLRVSKIGNAGAEDLVRDIKDLRLLWLAGEDHTAIAAPASVEIDVRSVYRSATLPVPTGFGDIVTRADYVLLHSARAAERLSMLVADLQLNRAKIAIAALSKNIAAAAGYGWKSVNVAAEPNDAALLSCL